MTCTNTYPSLVHAQVLDGYTNKASCESVCTCILCLFSNKQKKIFNLAVTFHSLLSVLSALVCQCRWEEVAMLVEECPAPSPQAAPTVLC